MCDHIVKVLLWFVEKDIQYGATFKTSNEVLSKKNYVDCSESYFLTVVKISSTCGYGPKIACKKTFTYLLPYFEK